ncbi:nucleolin 1 [Gossypium australe]|uniref:Nucleolin 1 n=1 Tax=Gossypium australe TaxID=47621 RepID=A0A5B6VQZ2_9ROSI|nr:nucleolin 1 [Gossypium australe]
MGSVDRVDDLTFKVNFSGDGAAKLKDRVKEKLKEFMGDYTDDTLVEYVIVLLRNGRRKDEAMNELNVFLGDDSNSFVSWLWDHLASNLDLYAPSREPYLDEGTRTTVLGNQSIGAESHQLDTDSERGKSTKFPRNRHNRDWKGLVRDATEPPPLRSSEVENIRFEEKSSRKVGRGRSTSPPPTQKKRSRPDERQPIKREAVPQMNIDAPRRLLQFAVRDAVGTSRAPISAKEPSSKRLRSVVSTSSGDLPARPRRIQSVARVPNPMATVIKAVAEAAEDVTKVKNAGSVFDRLGPGMDVLETRDLHPEFRESLTEDEEYGDLNQPLEKTHSAYYQREEYAGRHVGNVTALESQTGLASESLSDNEWYGDVDVVGHGVMDESHTGHTGRSSRSKGDNSLMVQYNVAKDDEILQTKNKDQNQSTIATNTSRKIVNISVNVNTWKPPHYQEPREVSELDSRKSLPESEAIANKANHRLMENGNPVNVGNGNVKGAAYNQELSQKAMQPSSASYAAARPLEDADSRTIFVSNVHFAATKDSLSRHFNKFGDVLKVIIVTDAATGQPKGSAYVEFMRKEAADNALSLDGTSFMSRILKVVKKSSAPQEAAAPVMTWPRVARGSPFVAARFGRASFARGMPGAFRPHLPIKPGARSFQWKRDAQTTTTPTDAVTGTNVSSPTFRSLTYVRTEPKSEGNATS